MRRAHVHHNLPQLGLAWFVLGVLWFASLGSRALITPDEGRYASAALAILQSGDWITPRLNGLLYFEKPILQYWIGAATFQVLGINEFAARVWPALSGFLSVVVVALTARRLWGKQAGRLGGAVAAGTTWMVANSHFLNLDTGLTFFLTLALGTFLIAQADGASETERRSAMGLCWAAMAGAVMSKGLVGLVIPGASVVLYSLLQRRFTVWRRMYWLRGLTILILLAAPWFVAVSIRNPAFFDFFFIREHFRRFLTDEAQRSGPLWYFLPVLFIGFLPWTSLLPGLVRLGVRGEQGLDFQPLKLLIAWAGFVLVFFSASHSKLSSYILPMFPALALIAARYLSLADPVRLRWHLVVPGVVWIAAMLGAPLVASKVAANVPQSIVGPVVQMTMVAAAIFLSCGAIAWLLLGRGRSDVAVWVLAIGSVAAVSLAMLGQDHYGRPLKSSKDLPSLMSGYLEPDTQVFAVRMYDQTLPFYLRRSITLVDFRGEFAFGEEAEPERWIPTLDVFAARWLALSRAVAMMPMQTYLELQKMQLPMRIVYQDAGRVVVVRPIKP